MASRADSEPSSTAEAPSLSGEALAAVMVPPLSAGRNDGLSPASCRHRRAGPDALVARESSTPRHRHHQVVVEAGGPGRVGQVVGPDRERVLPLPRDREPVGQQLVGLAQRDGPLRGHPLVDEPPAERRGHRGHVAGGIGPRRLRQHPRRPGHRLDAAGQHHVGVPGLDGPRAGHRRVERGAAEPVDRHRRHRDRQAGEQHRHPADVAVVLAGAVGVAPDHVADPLRVEAGRLRQQAGDRRRRPGRRVVRRPAHRRSARTACAPRRTRTRLAWSS